MEIKIITRSSDIPVLPGASLFLSPDWMALFDDEKFTRCVVFLVEEDGRPIMAQSVIIQRYLHWLPAKYGSYAVAWYEPWSAEGLRTDSAHDIFSRLMQSVLHYCRRRAVCLELRHFSDSNDFDSILCGRGSEFGFNRIPWWNIVQHVDPEVPVRKVISRDKRKQVNSSAKHGVSVSYSPTEEQWIEWYGQLSSLYRRIRRPLPAWNVFNRARTSPVCDSSVVLYDGRVMCGCIVLRCGSKRYEWYRSSSSSYVDGVHPSVVSVFNSLERLYNDGGGTFDYMGAGQQGKEYGVRDFKLRFGGELTPEFRYRKWLLF